MAGLNLKVNVSVLQATRELNRLGTSLVRLQKDAARAQGGFSRLGGVVGNLAAGIVQLGGAIAVFGAGAAARKAIEFSADFEKSLADINTILGDSEVSLDSYRDKLLRLSTQSSKTLEDLSKGLYQTISAGIPSIEGASGAFAVLEASQRAAVAGLTETNIAVDAVTSVLNTYGRESMFATEVTDQLFTAVRLGKTRFDDLARGIGRVAPIAKEAGVSLDDLLAAFVSITRKGISPRETITGLRNLLRGIVKPSKQAEEALERFNVAMGKTGKEQLKLGAGALRDGGIVGFINRLNDFNAGEIEQLTQIFPNIRALLPVLALTGEGTKELNDIFQEFQNTAGATGEAFDKVDAVLSETFDKVISNLGRLAVIGSENVLKELNQFFKELNESLGSDEAARGARRLFDNVSDVFKAIKRFGPPALQTLQNFGVFIAAAFAGKAIMAFGPILFSALTSLRLFFTQARAGALTFQGTLLTLEAGLRRIGAAAAGAFSALLIFGPFIGNDVAESFKSATREAAKFELRAIGVGEKIPSMLEVTKLKLQEVNTPFVRLFDLLTGGAVTQAVFAGQQDAVNEKLRQQREELERIAKLRGFSTPQDQDQTSQELKTGKRFDFSVSDTKVDPAEQADIGGEQIANLMRSATIDAFSDIGGVLDGELETVLNTERDLDVLINLKPEQDDVSDSIRNSFGDLEGNFRKVRGEIDSFFGKLKSLDKGSILTAQELTNRLSQRLSKSGKLSDLESTQVARATTMLILQTKLNRLRELQSTIQKENIQDQVFEIDGIEHKTTLAMKNALLQREEAINQNRILESSKQALRSQIEISNQRIGDIKLQEEAGEINSFLASFRISQEQALIDKAEEGIEQKDVEIQKNLQIIKTTADTIDVELGKTPAILSTIASKISELLVTLGILDAEKDTLKTQQQKAANAAARAAKREKEAKKAQALLNLETIKNRELEKIRRAQESAKEEEVKAQEILIEKKELELAIEERSLDLKRLSLSMMRTILRSADGQFKINEKAVKQADEISKALSDRLKKLKEIKDIEKNVIDLQMAADKLELFNISEKAKNDLTKTKAELEKIQEVLKDIKKVRAVEDIAERAKDLVVQLNRVKIPDLEEQGLIDSDTEDGKKATNIINDAKNARESLRQATAEFKTETESAVAEVFRQFNEVLVVEAGRLLKLAEDASVGRAESLIRSFRGTLNSATFDSTLSDLGERVGASLNEAALAFEQRLVNIGKNLNIEIPVTPVFDVQQTLKDEVKKLLQQRLEVDALPQGEQRNTAERQFGEDFTALLNRFNVEIGNAQREQNIPLIKALQDLLGSVIAAIGTSDIRERQVIIESLRRTIDEKVADLGSEVAQSAIMLVAAELAFRDALEDLKRFFKFEFVENVLSSVAGLITGDFRLDMMGFFEQFVFVPFAKSFEVVETFLTVEGAKLGLKIQAFGESLFKAGGIFENFSLTDFSLKKAEVGLRAIGDGAIAAFNGIRSLGSINFSLAFDKFKKDLGEGFSNFKAAIGAGISSIKKLGDSNTWKSFGQSIKDGFVTAKDSAKTFFNDVKTFLFEPQRDAEGNVTDPSRFIKALLSVRGFIDAAFIDGVKRTVDGFKVSVRLLRRSIVESFKAGAALVSAVVGKVLGSIAAAIKKPFDMIFGALDQAFGSLMPSISKEKRREQEKKDLEKKLKESREEARQRAQASRERAREILDNVKALKDVGASNEEIARAQSEFVDTPLLEEDDDDEEEEEETPFDIIDNVFSRAIEFVEKFIELAPQILESFLTKLIESLPALIQGLTTGLISVLNVLAEKLPELITVLTTELVNALPQIIDALIAMVPAVIESIIIAITIILQKLPEIVIGLIDAIIEAIPLIFDALIESLPQLITALVGAVPRIIGALILLIPRLFYAVIAEVPRLIAAIIREFPNMLAEFARGLYDGVVRAFSDMLGTLGSLGGTFSNLGNIFGAVGAAFERLIGQITGVFKKTGSFIGGVFRAATGDKENASTAERVVAGILTLGVSEFLHDGGMVEKKSPPVSPLKAFRDLGVQGFSTGGMVYDTMRKRFRASLSDEVPAILQTGEAVLNRDAVSRMGGEPAINAINSGAGMAPNVNLNVGINPNAGGLNSVVSALLPLLIESINVTPSNDSSSSSRVLGARLSSLGYRTVPGKG